MNPALILNPSIIRPLMLKWKFGLKTAWALGFSLVIALIGCYVFQINEVTRASFNIANYEKQMADAEKDFKNLQINFSNLNSLSSLEALLASAGYEKVGQVHYIQMLESTVVSK